MSAKLSKDAMAELISVLNQAKPARLRCDGHEIFAIVQRLRANSLRVGLVIRIDGQIKNEWVACPTDIVRKVWRSRTRHAYNRKSIELARRHLASGVKNRDLTKKAKQVLSERVTEWLPIFPSVDTFVRQITRTCESVEWVRNDGQEAA
ncbi:MAG: hypothetical protein U1E83_06820 [Methylotetracoccus sp.]